MNVGNSLLAEEAILRDPSHRAPGFFGAPTPLFSRSASGIPICLSALKLRLSVRPLAAQGMDWVATLRLGVSAHLSHNQNPGR